MKIIKTKDFARVLEKLPSEIQKIYQTHEDHLKNNWRDPRLHIKKVAGLPRVFSFRITRRYRAFFYFQNTETVIVFDIDHRKDAYR